MSVTKEEIIKDLQSCGESLNRIIEFTEENYSDAFYYNHHAVLQENIVCIVKLKRELNKIYRKLKCEYIRSEGIKWK